jgi:hypothetical protein
MHATSRDSRGRHSSPGFTGPPSRPRSPQHSQSPGPASLAGRPGLQGRWPNRRPPQPGDVAAPTAGPVPGLPFPAVLAARACAKMRGPPPPANDLTPASAHQRRAIVTTTASRLGHLAHRGGPRPRISTALTGFPRQVTSCEAIRTGLCKNITK